MTPEEQHAGARAPGLGVAGRMEERPALNVQLFINVGLKEGRTPDELGVLLDAPSLAEQFEGLGVRTTSPECTRRGSAARR